MSTGLLPLLWPAFSAVCFQEPSKLLGWEASGLAWFLFPVPLNEIVPLGQIPIADGVCLCVSVCLWGDVVQLVFRRAHLRCSAVSFSFSSSLVPRVVGWPWSNLLCFLTPVKLHPEACVCVCALLLPSTQNSLPSGDTSLAAQPAVFHLHSSHPLFHSLLERWKGTEKCQMWSSGRDGWSLSIQNGFWVFLLLKMGT